MKLKPVILTAFLLSPAMFTAMPAQASEHKGHEHDEEEHRQHAAHVHGIAELNVVLEGNEVHVELDSPAANIVGFEHAPSSEADHGAVDKAVAILKQGSKLFVFNEAAGCRQEEVDIESALIEDEHGEHAHEDGHSDEHGHEDEEVHSEFEVAYHFECAAPAKLTQLSVELFEMFPGTGKLEVQYVIEDKQGAAELNAKNHVIKF